MVFARFPKDFAGFTVCGVLRRDEAADESGESRSVEIALLPRVLTFVVGGASVSEGGSAPFRLCCARRVDCREGVMRRLLSC